MTTKRERIQAALVDEIDGDTVQITLVNTSPLKPRRMILQAGAFGEHTITQAADLAAESATPVAVGNKWLQVDLEPSGTVKLKLEMQRYVNAPGYERPEM